MKILQTVTIILLLIVTACGKYTEDSKQLTLEQLEQKVRKEQDSKAVYTFDQYEKVMQALKNKNCVVLPIYKFKDYHDNTKIVVGLRHDIDHHPFKAYQMAQIELSYGYKSTYYVLPTAVYYGYRDKDGNLYHYTCLNNIYSEMYKMGDEIGMHNDMLTVMIEWGKEDLKKFNGLELIYFKMLGIPFYGSVGHGSRIAGETNVSSAQIFKDFAKSDSIFYGNKSYPLGIDSMKNFEYQYEAYYLDYTKFLQDVGGKLRFLDKSNGQYIASEIDFNQFIEVINNLKEGDRLIILTHPVWWGKNSN